MTVGEALPAGFDDVPDGGVAEVLLDVVEGVAPDDDAPPDGVAERKGRRAGALEVVIVSGAAGVVVVPPAAVEDDEVFAGDGAPVVDPLELPNALTTFISRNSATTASTSRTIRRRQ
ncbi:MAG: hypothetical protein ACTHMS_03535 [Jatrophihabitans sp.]|uniref:hypothetical protein n=1 Tax=Jatrophihabitans sp. TaxID=1932789 RepID=UPI003F7D1226